MRKTNKVKATIKEDVIDDIDMIEPDISELEEVEEEEIDFTSANIDDSMKMYLMEISQYDVLTREEEIRYAKDIEIGRYAQEVMNDINSDGIADMYSKEDIDELHKSMKMAKRAKDKMINHNLRLVVYVAKKYTWSNIDTLDLIQEGNLGLMTAVEKYKADTGYKFSTYATWWIKHYITRSIANNSNNIRVPVYVSEIKAKINKAISELICDAGETPTAEEIAEYIDMNVDKVKEVMELSVDTISIDKHIGDDENSTIADVVADNSGNNPADIVEQNELHDSIEQFLDTVLKPNEAYTIRMRFGIEDGSTRTFEEIGSVLNVSRQRVKAIEKKAIEKMQNEFAKEENSNMVEMFRIYLK